MNSEVKEQWTAALRSGEYAQDKNYLRTNEGYCCLGVLCELAVKANVIPEPEQLNRMAVDGHYYKYSGGAYSTLPASVMLWAELDDWNPKVPAPDGMVEDHIIDDQTTLAELNDLGYTFNEIADTIEENL